MAETPETKSLVRAVLGVVALLVSLVVIPIGFVLLVLDAERHEMTRSLSVLMAGGFFLAFGIALLIWELSVRYGIRR